MIHVVGTTYARGKVTIRVLHKRINQLKTKQASDNWNMVNIFVHFQRQFSVLQMADATSLQTKLKN